MVHDSNMLDNNFFVDFCARRGVEPTALLFTAWCDGRDVALSVDARERRCHEMLLLYLVEHPKPSPISRPVKVRAERPLAAIEPTYSRHRDF